MKEIISIAGSIAITFTTALCSYLFGKLQAKETAKSAREKADLVLLRDKLIYYYSKYEPTGEMPQVLYDNMLEMCECYLALGGNGKVRHMCEQMKGLRIV